MTEEGLLVVENDIEVNGYDIDAMGIMKCIVYIRWFEDLRTIFINQYMNYSEMMKQGISPILMKTEVEYKVPITIHDKPVGRCWFMKVVAQNGFSNLKLRLRIVFIVWDTKLDVFMI